MKTVLLAWELGANFGHVGPLRRLAREFRALGYKAVFVLRDVVGPSALLADEGWPILQAPVWPRTMELAGRPFNLSSYADILALIGFSHVESLAAMVEAWDRIIDLVAPDLIIADHSPTLCLAAYRTIPVAVIGTGFTMPPAHDPVFPPFRPDQPPLASETRLRETVQAVQTRRGRPAPPTLPALLDAPLRAITSFPELDPYRRSRREPLLGPLEALPAWTPMPREPGLFAYLGGELPTLAIIVQCIVESGCRAEAYLRGEVDGLRRFLASQGVLVHDRPPPLAEAVARASVVVSQAGSATAHAALAAGRPQVLLPLHLEADLTATALEKLGVGLRIAADADKAKAAETLAQALEDQGLRTSAEACAVSLAARPRPDATATLVEACLGLLGAKK